METVSRRMVFGILKNAFYETMTYRETTFSRVQIIEILDMIYTSKDINELWNKYVNEYPFTKNITFGIVYKEVRKMIMTLITKE